MTKRTKTVHVPSAIEPRTDTIGRKSDADYGCNCGDSAGCGTCASRIDAIGSQVGRVAIAVHTNDVCIDELVKAVRSANERIGYYAWGAVIACVIALASLWVALVR